MASPDISTHSISTLRLLKNLTIYMCIECFRPILHHFSMLCAVAPTHVNMWTLIAKKIQTAYVCHFYSIDPVMSISAYLILASN